jgi:hypothetical protein
MTHVLPSVDELVRDIRDALEEVEKHAKLTDPRQEGGGWTNVIAEAISRRVRRPGVECVWGRTRARPR